MLLPIALYIDAQETADAFDLSALARFLTRSNGMCLLGTRQACTGTDRPTAAVDVRSASSAEQRAAWEAAIGTSGPSGVAAALSSQFDLAPSAIAELAAAVAAEAPVTPDDSTRARLWALAPRARA
jgi:hypothetical protein